MNFVNQNGKPKLFKHTCLPERLGKSISKTELQNFGIDLLTALYESNGLKIKDINRVESIEFPQFVMESKNGKIYYVVVATTIYPNDPYKLPKNQYSEIAKLAHKFDAIPVFAGLGFTNAFDFCNAICGVYYYVSFTGLQQL
jgi:hypothetical protein